MWEFVAVFIALIALIFSITQGLEERKFKRLSVKPKIDDSRDPDCYQFTIKNNGLGPAIIKEVIWVSDEKEYKNPNPNEFADYADSIFLKVPWIQLTILTQDTWIKSGECYDIFQRNHRTNPDLNNQSRRGIRKIKGKIKYQDIYGTEFVSSIDEMKS